MPIANALMDQWRYSPPTHWCVAAAIEFEAKEPASYDGEQVQDISFLQGVGGLSYGR